MNITQPAKTSTLPFSMPGKFASPGNHQRGESKVKWAQHRIRNHVIAWAGEFVGTFMFLFMAFSATQVANFVAPGDNTPSPDPNTAHLLYIALAFGFSLAVNAWVFFRITGGLFNPAVTLGLCLIAAISWPRAVTVFTAQIVGGIAASAVVYGLFPGSMNVLTGLGPSTSIIRGVFIEMFLTAELIFTIFMLAAEKHKGTFLAPVGIGLALFISELTGVYFTGASLNPARSFGPAVIEWQFDSYHWIYWVGPALGSLVAVVFYKLVKRLEYESANPGQDDDEKEHEAGHFRNDEMPEAPLTNQSHALPTVEPKPAEVPTPDVTLRPWLAPNK